MTHRAAVALSSPSKLLQYETNVLDFDASPIELLALYMLQFAVYFVGNRPDSRVVVQRLERFPELLSLPSRTIP